MDVKPPKNWRRPAASQPAQPTEMEPTKPVEPGLLRSVETELVGPDSAEPVIITKKQPRRKWLFIVAGAILAVAIAAGSAGWWYIQALQPRDSEAILQKVTVESGMTPRSIGQMLEEKSIIRSSLAFEIYASTTGRSGSLQAGTYKLGGSQPVSEIVDHLSKGLQDSYDVTILPGMTLKQLADPNIKRPNAKNDEDRVKTLATQGFSAAEIERAFAASYSSPLLKDRPEGQGLEGYLLPETYKVGAGDSLESLLQRAIDEFYSRLQAEGLIEKFAARGLNIHQAITLASIVQQEVGEPSYQPQVAQVFLTRLDIGMMLGSDVTYIYAAKQAGAIPSPDYESPYNTRKYAGLPPGPIGTVTLSALKAIVEPAEGDYLYFVAGDDGVTYFSRTLEEHEALRDAHCIKLCKL